MQAEVAGVDGGHGTWEFPMGNSAPIMGILNTSGWHCGPTVSPVKLATEVRAPVHEARDRRLVFLGSGCVDR